MSGGGNNRSGLELMADREPCEGPCDVCELFEPIGPDRDAWKARIRTALTAAGSAARGRPKSATHRAAIAATLRGNTNARGNAGHHLSAAHRAAIAAGVRRRLERKELAS
jgi:hypothetical protein